MAPHTNELGLEVYDALAARPGNLAIAPVSIARALAAVHEAGSDRVRGELAFSLAYVSHDPYDDLRAIAVLDRELADRAPGYRTAASLWVAASRPPREDVASAIRTHHATSVESYRSPEELISKLGDWLAGHGGEGHRALAAESPSDGAVLATAMRYRARWRTPFSVEATRPAAFAILGGPVTVPMMTTSGRFRVASRDGVDAIALPFDDEALDLVLMMPSDPARFASLEADLRRRSDAWLDALADEGEVLVQLPRFSIAVETSLVAPLRAAHLGSLFEDGALPGLCATCATALRLVDARQRIELAVDEHGVTVTGSTTLVAGGEARRTFVADRPFVWMLRDRSTGAIIALGRIVDPSARAARDA